jgi:non-canonical purine NTP pyrophosphatase (RdgB/HAM1 family)
VRVYLATKNAGKRAEFQALLAGTGIELREFPGYRDVIEGEAAYAENAALKARALREQLLSAGIEAAVLADDSGLEIDALDGRPGVITAYYGGADLTWAERREYVLSELARFDGDDRRARFVCYLHFIDDEGAELAVNASVEGTIATRDRGEHGFSFDPIFVYPAAQKTFSELTTTEKNAVSHRRRAVAELLHELRKKQTALPKT